MKHNRVIDIGTDHQADKMKKIQDERNQLRQALIAYGRHKLGCVANVGRSSCECGWSSTAKRFGIYG